MQLNPLSGCTEKRVGIGEGKSGLNGGSAGFISEAITEGVL